MKAKKSLPAGHPIDSYPCASNTLTGWITTLLTNRPTSNTRSLCIDSVRPQVSPCSTIRQRLWHRWPVAWHDPPCTRIWLDWPIVVSSNVWLTCVFKSNNWGETRSEKEERLVSRSTLRTQYYNYGAQVMMQGISFATPDRNCFLPSISKGKGCRTRVTNQTDMAVTYILYL